MNLPTAPDDTADSFRGRTVQLFTLLVLAIGLGATALLFRIHWQDAETRTRHAFADECNSLASLLDDRIEHLKQILHSGAGMVTARQTVSREEWSTFYGRQQLKKTLPGIQGLGFAVVIPPEQLQMHMSAIRAEGFPDYRVWPEGPRSLYSAIVFLEPFDNRNRRAFGYDMYSEPVRRAAMQRACDLNEAVLSGPVTLAQETGENLQVGTLMYVPVYRVGGHLETVSDRRAALAGWVYSPYRMDDLIRGTLGHSKRAVSDIRLRIFDGATEGPGNMLFDSHRESTQPTTDKMRLSHKISIETAGRTWLLRFNGHHSEFAANYFNLAWYSLLGGGLLSILLAGLVYSLLTTKFRAHRIAETLTAVLQQSEERWKFATEGSNIGVWDWDIKNGQVVYSRRWKAMLDYAEDEISNSVNEWKSRVHHLDLTPTLEKIEAHFQGKTSHFEGEFRFRAKDDSFRWIRGRGLVVKWDEAKRPLRMVGTHTDITLEKNYTKELAEMLERQRQITQMKSRFISITSHEFRTPLAAALASAELINNHAESITPEKRRALITRIAISVQRMAELLDEVLTLNRIEEGQLKPRPAAIDLRALVEGIIEEIVVADKGVHAIELSAPADVQATLDPTITRKILTNLLSNATRYSPANTTIKVLLEMASAQVRLVVEDQGIGIPAKDLKRLFDPFERGSNVGEINGSGLGLSIVKRMTNLLNGSIEVESVEGRGSRFTVILQAHPGPTNNRS